MKTSAVLAVAAISLLGHLDSVSADILKATTFRLEAVDDNSNFLPLNGSNDTEVTFDIPGNKSERIAITYSATCGVAGPVAGFVDIDILVDGVEIAPTDTSGEIFCQSDATEALDSFERATIIGVKTLRPGKHKVKVYAELLGGATSFQIGYSTLMIQE